MKRSQENIDQVATWAEDLFRAATEMGYGVLEVEPARIALQGGSDRIDLASKFLSGEYLRNRLRPIPEDAS